MKLVSNWRRVLRKSWAIRLSIVSCLLSTAELVLQLLTPQMPSGRFIAAAAVVSLLAGIARVIEQRSLHDGKP